jgi:RNA polymerase sigma factor (TIGR02999 family)
VENLDRLTSELYSELRRLAAGALRGERPDHTLQPTALVHEVYLKLSAAQGLEVADRAQFLGLAARAMRQILVDYARTRKRKKRGGAPVRVTLGANLAAGGPPVFDLLALDEALERLSRVSDQQVRIIELRYLAGLSVEETAQLLEISPTTVKRDTAMAKAWLYRELKRSAGD